MVTQIFIGLLGIAIGICLVVYARWFVGNFGVNANMERHLGAGGTYTGLRLIGIIVIIISFLYMTGLLGKVLTEIGQSVTGV